MDLSSTSYFIFTWTFFIFYDITDCIPLTQSSTPPLPPLLFPQDPQIYRIVPPNETALKILRNSEKSAQTSLFPRERLFLDDPRREVFKISNMHVDDVPEVFPSDYAAESLKSEVEEIQPSDEKTKQKVELEEQYRSIAANLRSNQIFPEDIETLSTTKLHHGHITAILIAGLLIVCIVIYAGLLSWRTYLEKRYGTRERLVQQDDYYNNEVRQFDI